MKNKLPMIKTIALILVGLSILIPASGQASTTTKKHHKKKDYKNQEALTVTNNAPEASSPLTGTFALTSNYIYRGISQTSNLPAVQGGLTYTFPSGVYFYIWGSNVNFLDFYGSQATVEFDTAAGITNNIGDNFNYNIYLVRYNYPRTAASYQELNANISYYFLTALYGYSSNVYNFHAPGKYYNVGFKFDVPSQYIFNVTNINVSGGIGHYSLPASVGLRSYNDYNLQISKTINNYVLALQWTDTNGRSIDLPQYRDSHIVGTLTANFG